jgi:CheY-like chemotaxis protein
VVVPSAWLIRTWEPSGVRAQPGGQQLRSVEGLRVLVVDDEPDARELVKVVLERCGIRVAAASSGPEARSMAAAERPDVVLADIGMPGEDGYEFIRRFRAEGGPALASVPVLALTAYGRPEDRLRALAAGFQAHLTKPVVGDEVLAAVISASRGASASR